ncbi:hypothetical protein Tco_0908384 [Tanacetum coccineum]|uniref:Uncharacterized protein n=1 Tax=Tanacetum coccineum TaxID=301880 RepID=A0ABQ5CTE6_9ASTR
MEGSSKRAREEFEQEGIKKQKVDEDKETAELQSLIEVVPDKEEITIDAILLATGIRSTEVGSNKKYSTPGTTTIEGDENSKFFHGIVNKKRRQQAIKGILVDGEWIDNPDRVKREFYNHFANIFSALNWSRVLMKGIFPRLLDADFSCDLEGDISDDEIKRREGVLQLEYFPQWLYPSLITLIPKVLDVKHLSDFHPISLIGCQYKIIGKILVNRLSLVVDELISHESFPSLKVDIFLTGILFLMRLLLGISQGRTLVVNGDGGFVAAFILQKLRSWLIVRQLTYDDFIERVIERGSLTWIFKRMLWLRTSSKIQTLWFPLEDVLEAVLKSLNSRSSLSLSISFFDFYPLSAIIGLGR